MALVYTNNGKDTLRTEIFKIIQEMEIDYKYLPDFYKFFTKDYKQRMHLFEFFTKADIYQKNYRYCMEFFTRDYEFRLEILEYMVTNGYRCRDLEVLGTFLLDDIDNKKSSAILRLKQLEIPFADFRYFIDFFGKDTLDKQAKAVELLFDVGVTPLNAAYGIQNFDLGVQNPKFHTAIQLR